jgi:hypothetical protein
MKKHYETHVEDTDKLISVAGPELDYKSWYEQYRKLMEEQAQRKYGLYTPTSEGDDDDFPSISGMIARYSASGLTNEEMSKNPVWVDKTGNGHDLQMKNFAWGGMSGVGGYEMNFNLWTNNVPSISDISMSKTTTSVSVSVGNSAYNNNLIYIHKNNWDINKNHWLKVASTYEDGDLVFIFYNDKNTKKIELPANGYANIPAYPEFKGSYMYISTTSNKQGSFTIEQLPLYPGALVFDGVDDYGVCDNFPILTKEKGYTVVVLRQWITRGERALGLVSNVKDWLNNGAFLLEYRNIQADHLNKPISFGAIGSEMDLPHILTYQTSKSYNGVSITTGNFEGTDVLHVGKLAPTNVGTCINAAIWELVFLDHDATEEELTKIKDYFVKTYPWLFPDQAWTVTGKTNEDEDRATIANITGNGNDLVLSNFAFSGNSGYGLYNIQKFTNWSHVADRGDIVKNGYSVTITNSKITGSSTNYNTDILYSYNSSLTTIIFKVTGLVDGQKIFLGRKNATDAYVIDKDGIYRSDYNIPQEDGKVIVGIGTVGFTGECNITIEQIPEYEGYLVTDGVDDKINSSNFDLGKDWTIVGDWTMLSNIPSNCGIIKASSLFLYNSIDSVTIYINNGGRPIKIQSKSINAICSDGRIYLNDWTEISKPGVQTELGSKANLNIASYGTTFTKMAFKNLAIYDGKILSKDDCIKAYNYLQTLKSK